MTGNLDEAIKTLLTSALPDLLGGATPVVALTVYSDQFVADPTSADAIASEPRPDDHSDQFSFNPVGIIFNPADPAYDPNALPKFTLSKPPYPGPKRVRLLTIVGDRLPLRENEVIWAEGETRDFRLALSPNRDLAGVNGVQVLYGVIAIFTMLKLNQTMSIQLESAAADQLEQCEALVTGIIALHRQELLDNSVATFDGGDYSATVKVNSLKLLEGNSPITNQRRLIYQVEIELKTTRALRDDEGRPIVRVYSPGRPLDATRRVDIEIGVDV
jgi:hypothetical protein